MNLKKILLVLLVGVFCFIPVVSANNDDVVIESIEAVSASDEVKLNSTEEIDVEFNDLDQMVEYEVVLKNNTNNEMTLNELQVSDSSEDFIEYILDEEYIDKTINANEKLKATIYVKTLDINQAGRNVNDEVSLKFVLASSPKNPTTSSNRLEIILSIIIISIMLYIIFSKHSKNAKFIVIAICLMGLGVTRVFAEEIVTAKIGGQIVYKSQNIIETSGIGLIDGQLIIDNSKEVWAYYDKVKNIYIKSDNSTIDQYYEKFDLTTNDKNRVTGYLVENNDPNVPYDLYIISKGIIYANEDSTGLFSFHNVEKIEGLNNIEFEDTKIFKGMFMGDANLSEIDVSSINFDSATDVSYMFYKADKVDVDVDNFELSVSIIKNNIVTPYLYGVVKKNAISDKTVVFTTAAKTAQNYYIEKTKNDNYPVYYFRGPVTDNNVIFGNICWKMVRTTGTGGVKLIYNGEPSDGTCDNTGEDSYIGLGSYDGRTSPAYVGYMYGQTYTVSNKALADQTETYVYGNDVSWDGEKYTLSDTKTSSSWSDDRETLATKYHYTCFNDTGSCTNVYYIHYFNAADKAYYLTLSNGKNIENAKSEMFTNPDKYTGNSDIKKMVDDWYAANIDGKDYEAKLEDTVWCNDRSLINGSLHSKDTDARFDNGYSSFGPNERVHNLMPSVECLNNADSFTVDNAKGNGNLVHPVGLLTIDEYAFAGIGQNAYLYTGVGQWTMSPALVSYYAYMSYFSEKGTLSSKLAKPTSDVYSVRPAISLKLGTEYLSGVGTVSAPYIINESSEGLIYDGK